MKLKEIKDAARQALAISKLKILRVEE